MTETFQGRVIVGRGDAESIAVQILNFVVFVVADLDRTGQFLNITGLPPETIRESAKSSLFLLGVLDYVSRDEELLKAIDNELNIRPAANLVAIVPLTPEPEVKPLENKPEAAPQLPRRQLFQ